MEARPSHIPLGQFSLREACLNRNFRLSGPAVETRREVRNRENEEAIGGMRNPLTSLKRCPDLARLGSRLSIIIDSFIKRHPSLLTVVEQMRQGNSSHEVKGFDKDLIALLRDEVASDLGIDFEEKSLGPVSARMFRIVAECSDDPDARVLAEWLEQGAPIGILHPIQSTGIFPKVDGLLHPSESLSWLYTDRGEEISHKTAEEDFANTEKLLREAESKGFAKIFECREDIEKYLGTSDLVFNPLGLIAKEKSDGSMKYRINWALLRTRVNEALSQGERIILPMLANVVDDLLTLSRSASD